MDALRALVDGYAVAVDERNGDDLRSLFTGDGVLAVMTDDGEAHRYVGDEIVEVADRLTAYDSTLHLVSTHRCVVDGDTAGGVAYCEAHHRRDGGDRVRYIRYDDRYARGRRGWRFEFRSVTTLWIDDR